VPVFDDSVRGSHPEDYLLLHNGHVHFYRHRWARDRLIADLSRLGYAAIEIDFSSCMHADAVREAMITAVPNWPTGYGQTTWPGFTDGLTDHLLHADRPLLVLVLSGLDRVRRRDETAVLSLLDLLASVARWHLLFGRRLLCLVETGDPELELPGLGCEHVGWNRHEWLIAHRTGTRLPPWIKAGAQPGGA
jgi:hypothetical protein